MGLSNNLWSQRFIFCATPDDYDNPSADLTARVNNLYLCEV